MFRNRFLHWILRKSLVRQPWHGLEILQRRTPLTEALQDCTNSQWQHVEQLLVEQLHNFSILQLKSPMTKKMRWKPPTIVSASMTPPTSAKKRILSSRPAPRKIAKVEGDGGIFLTDAYFRGLQIMPPTLLTKPTNILGMGRTRAMAPKWTLVLLKTLAVHRQFSFHRVHEDWSLLCLEIYNQDYYKQEPIFNQEHMKRMTLNVLLF